MTDTIDPWRDPLGVPPEETPPHGAFTPPDDEIPELARHADPSRRDFAPEVTAETQRLQRGIVWMRPTELIPHTTAHAAGRGIDFQAELARRTRSLPAHTAAASRRAISARTSALPPLASFGAPAPRQDAIQRNEPGL